MKMSLTSKILYSLVVGVIATIIAKFVHPIWNLNQLIIFGLAVFIVTVIVIFIVASLKGKLTK
jgi:hypothetical protein